MHLKQAATSQGVQGMQTLNTVGMDNKVSLWGAPEAVYYRLVWVQVDHGGILCSNVNLGGVLIRVKFAAP